MCFHTHPNQCSFLANKYNAQSLLLRAISLENVINEEKTALRRGNYFKSLLKAIDLYNATSVLYALLDVHVHVVLLKLTTLLASLAS